MVIRKLNVLTYLYTYRSVTLILRFFRDGAPRDAEESDTRPVDRRDSTGAMRDV